MPPAMRRGSDEAANSAARDPRCAEGGDRRMGVHGGDRVVTKGFVPLRAANAVESGLQPSRSFRAHRAGIWILAVFSLVALAACQPKHVEVGEEPELDYPSCAAERLAVEPVAGTVTRGALQAAEGMIERGLVERYEIRKLSCGYRYRATQAWAGGHTEVEMVYDPAWRPLRAWRRMSAPGPRGTERLDVRRYELRTPEPRIRKVTIEGVLGFEHLRGKFPQILVAPSRASLVPWVRSAHLEAGQKQRLPALDFRERLEKVRDVTLKREADRYHPEFGKNVRVYTLYGREAYFFDEEDGLLGDLAGMRVLSDGKTERFFQSQDPLLPPSL